MSLSNVGKFWICINRFCDEESSNLQENYFVCKFLYKTYTTICTKILENQEGKKQLVLEIDGGLKGNVTVLYLKKVVISTKLQRVQFLFGYFRRIPKFFYKHFCLKSSVEFGTLYRRFLWIWRSFALDLDKRSQKGIPLKIPKLLIDLKESFHILSI